VTFVPDQQPRMGVSPVVRTILFWLLMVVLATVLWRMAESDERGRAGTGDSSTSMSYSDFVSQVDKNNISSVRILESPSTAEVRGQLRQPNASFRVTIPKESIPELTQRLQKQGVSIEVSTARDSSWRSTAINLLPIIIIVALWILSMSRRSGRSMRKPPASPATPTTPTVPTNRPLG
jgi:ATP-dependent Zn protease